MTVVAPDIDLDSGDFYITLQITTVLEGGSEIVLCPPIHVFYGFCG
jgi:hypothetical protein